MIDFSYLDIFRILTLAFLEMLLSADNAIVLGTLSHALPIPLRKKALFIGLVSAFVFRLIALLFISYLLQYSWFERIGSAYLIYLCIAHFWVKSRSIAPPAPRTFWQTVFLIELFDLIFALDSIIAGIAFINGDANKLWLVYVGGMIGLIGMRFAASWFSSLLDRFPRLETSAYLLVGWVGIKLGFHSFHAPLPLPLFWSITFLLFLLGFIPRKR